MSSITHSSTQRQKRASLFPSWRLCLHAVVVTLLVSFLAKIPLEWAVAAEDADVSPRGTVSITRNIVSGLANENNCDFAGTIVVGGFFTLESDDKFHTIGSAQLTAFNLMMDQINRYKCGVTLMELGSESNTVEERNYALELRTFDDQSSTAGSSFVGYKLVNDTSVDIMVGGYSSTLTQPYVEIAHNYSEKLVMAPGAASTKVFLDKPLAFGMFPPSSKYLLQAIKALATINGATSIASVWEDASFTRGVCAAAPELAAQYGMTMTSMTEVVKSPNTTVLAPIAALLKDENPDVVITCVYDCLPWIQALRQSQWNPKAQVFTVCVGQEKFTNEAGTDATFIMGVTPWDASLKVKDAVTGWTPSEFAARFRSVLSAEDTSDVSYHPAMAAALISILYQTIQGVSDFRNNGPQLADYISKNTFPTMGGQLSFDRNGQSQAPSLLIQYDLEGTVQTVYPPETASGKILYPMPSWERRDCLLLSVCEGRNRNSTDDFLVTGNRCDDTGICICDDALYFQPVGSGATAACIPLEDMNYINPALKITTWLACGILLACCIYCLGWIYYYRENALVRVSQPLFLGILVVGSIVSSSSIIPMSVETSYREDSDTIRAVDAACMAIPWLWGMGCAITYSALFAKVWRVQKLYKLAHAMRRQKVTHKDVYFIIVFMVTVEMVVLIAMQIVSPHVWQRDVIREIGGYSIESIGSCSSDSGWWFFATLVVLNVFCLFVALILCWKTKDIPSDFAESNYIFLSVMFMFQILLLAVPVSVMVRDDNNVFFFIRVAAVFLQNFTVLVLIFLPKMRRIYIGEDTTTVVKNAMRASCASISVPRDSMFSRNQSTTEFKTRRTSSSFTSGNRNKNSENSHIEPVRRNSDGATEQTEIIKKDVTLTNGKISIPTVMVDISDAEDQDDPNRSAKNQKHGHEHEHDQKDEEAQEYEHNHGASSTCGATTSTVAAVTKSHDHNHSPNNHGSSSSSPCNNDHKQEDEDEHKKAHDSYGYDHNQSLYSPASSCNNNMIQNNEQEQS